MTGLQVPPRRTSENGRQYAFRVLRENIMCLSLEPGQQLSEQELSVALNISRTPIREAILSLQESRLIEVLPQRSSCVSRIDMRCVEEGVFIRHAVETAVMREAAKRAGSGDLSALRENLSLQKLRISEERWSEYVEADNEFHRLMYAAAGMPWIWTAVTAVTTHLTRLRRMQYCGDISTFKVGFEEHQHFYDAIAENRDDDFSEVVYAHLTAGYRKVLPQLKRDFPHYFTE